MSALLLSILASSLLFVVFYMFKKYNIHNLQAIVVNYYVAACLGVLLFNLNLSEVLQKPWFFYAIGMGSFFVVVFLLMAYTTQIQGLASVSVATKMSLILPICVGIFYFKDSLTLFKILGVILALPAVYLATYKTSGSKQKRLRQRLLPLLVFLGSGFIDSGLKILEAHFVPPADIPLFTTTLFLSAATVGSVWVAIGYLKKEIHWASKNAVAGIALGIPNYFSVYFLIQAFKIKSIDSSSIFTLNNVAVVLVSTLIGYLAFKEVLNLKNKLGIAIAVISLVLISLSV